MNVSTQNIVLATQVALMLMDRATQIMQQVKTAHETGEGITDEQLGVIRSGVDVSRANLVAAIESLDEQPAPEPVGA